MDRIDLDSVVPSADQRGVIARILAGYRTIVAGAPGTGRTITAMLTARAWAHGETSAEGPALLLVRRRDPAIVAAVDIVATVMTHAELDAHALDGTAEDELKHYGLIIVDDGGDGSYGGTADAVHTVLALANDARIVRFVDSGRNDADASVVLTERFRHHDEVEVAEPSQYEQQRQYALWGQRLRAIAREMQEANFDMQALAELAGQVEALRDRCEQLRA